MRLLALLLVVGLAACQTDASDSASTLTEADRLLAAVDPAAFAPAFQALGARDVVADFRVVETGPDGADVGQTALRLQMTPAGARLLRQSGTGTLAEPAGGDPPRLSDPVSAALPDDPAFADPASRDQYSRTIVGDTVMAGQRLRLVEAVLTDSNAEQGVRRVRAAVDPESGQARMVEVERAADSAIYDERSRIRVVLAPTDGAWLPRRVETDTWTDVPLSEPRRIRTSWDVVSVGADSARTD